MKDLTRRSFLQASAAAAMSLCAGSIRAAESAPATQSADRYVTSFYQFNAEAIRRLSYRNALPNGPRFEHLFVQSTADVKDQAKRAKQVHAAGESYKFCWAYDAHRYKGWERASDDELKKWAKEFRDAAFSGGSPPDYFAFNEMPDAGPSDAELRARITKLIRYLHDPGDGPKWPGLFYFVESNSRPENWRGDSTEFWETVDETCQHVVAEHFHTERFVFARTLQQFSDHLFGFPRWLRDSGHAPRANIALHKYAVLHSSYWGRGYHPWTSLYRDLRQLRFHPSAEFYQEPRITPWEGMIAEEHDAMDLEKYIQRCVAATRMDELGKSRISFSPLAIGQPMGYQLLPTLARVLGKDAAKFAKEAL